MVKSKYSKSTKRALWSRCYGSRTRCKCTTQSGKACRNIALEGGILCTTHLRTTSGDLGKPCYKGGLPPSTGNPRKAADPKTRKTTQSGAPKKCKCLTQAGVTCRRYAVTGSNYCPLHKRYFKRSKGKECGVPMKGRKAKKITAEVIAERFGLPRGTPIIVAPSPPLPSPRSSSFMFS